MSIGIQVFKINNTFREILLENYDSGALLVVAFGTGVILIAIIGFIGACFKSVTLLDLYVYIFIILFAFNIVALCIGWTHPEDYEEKFDNGSYMIGETSKNVTKILFFFI